MMIGGGHRGGGGIPVDLGGYFIDHVLMGGYRLARHHAHHQIIALGADADYKNQQAEKAAYQNGQQAHKGLGAQVVSRLFAKGGLLCLGGKG